MLASTLVVTKEKVTALPSLKLPALADRLYVGNGRVELSFIVTYAVFELAPMLAVKVSAPSVDRSLAILTLKLPLPSDPIVTGPDIAPPTTSLAEMALPDKV